MISYIIIIEITATVLTIVGMWLYGRPGASGPIVSLLAAPFWFVFVIHYEAWGIIPFHAIMTVINGINVKRRSKELTRNG